MICTFASSNPIPQRRNRVEEEFLKSYFGSGFNFRANRNRNIDVNKDAINNSKNYATVSKNYRRSSFYADSVYTSSKNSSQSEELLV